MIMDEIFSKEFIICPYCGYENNPADSDGLAYDENTSTYICESCDKELLLRVYYTYCWTTRKG